MDEKMVPVQGHQRVSPDGVHPQVFLPAGQVPESVARLAYEIYAIRHGNQSFERLHERGGFDWAELIGCLRGDYMKGSQQAADDLRRIHKASN